MKSLPSVIDLRRSVLAGVAAQLGITLEEEPDGRWYAASPRDQFRHYVTLLSCDCGAFLAADACVHHSALLVRLGQLPPVHPAAESAA